MKCIDTTQVFSLGGIYTFFWWLSNDTLYDCGCKTERKNREKKGASVDGCLVFLIQFSMRKLFGLLSGFSFVSIHALLLVGGYSFLPFFFLDYIFVSNIY